MAQKDPQQPHRDGRRRAPVVTWLRAGAAWQPPASLSGAPAANADEAGSSAASALHPRSGPKQPVEAPRARRPRPRRHLVHHAGEAGTTSGRLRPQPHPKRTQSPLENRQPGRSLLRLTLQRHSLGSPTRGGQPSYPAAANAGGRHRPDCAGGEPSGRRQRPATLGGGHHGDDTRAGTGCTAEAAGAAPAGNGSGGRRRLDDGHRLGCPDRQGAELLRRSVGRPFRPGSSTTSWPAQWCSPAGTAGRERRDSACRGSDVELADRCGRRRPRDRLAVFGDAGNSTPTEPTSTPWAATRRFDLGASGPMQQRSPT